MKEIFLVALSIIGFAVSFYIYNTKKQNKKMYCIVGQDCDEVVKSQYGKTFGIENTIPGMAFYLLVLVYGFALLLNRNVFIGNIVYYPIVIASLASVTFSIYLTGVQAFILKKWCEYCIVSSIASVLILVVLVS